MEGRGTAAGAHGTETCSNDRVRWGWRGNQQDDASPYRHDEGARRLLGPMARASGSIVNVGQIGVVGGSSVQVWVNGKLVL